MSRGVRFGVFRRFVFQTGDVHMLLMKIHATKELAEEFSAELGTGWARILEAQGTVEKKSFKVANILSELGVGQIQHVVLPVDYDEPLVTTDLRILGKVGH